MRNTITLNRFRFLAAVLAFCVAVTGPVLFAAERQAEWDGVRRIVAIGDIHGDFERYKQLLREADLITSRYRWVGRDTHLVQLGDVVDRGADSQKILRLLRSLEEQAPRKGGQVHYLIGNHEAMRFVGDTRYVAPGEYAAFVDRDSGKRQARYYEASVEHLRKTLPAEELPVFDDAYRKEWEAKFPRGYVELRVAWAPDGPFGAWVARHNAVIRINDTLFVHGGLHPDLDQTSLTEINERIRAELRLGERVGDDALVNQRTGPLWYRGLAEGDETCANLAAVRATLAAHGARRIVVGHTPVAGAILPRFDGAVLVADAGISSHYEGSRTAVVIEDGSVYALHNGKRISLAAPRTEYLAALAQAKPVAPLLARYLADPERGADPDLTCPPNAMPEISPDSATESAPPGVNRP